jgi:hypothetical protein
MNFCKISLLTCAETYDHLLYQPCYYQPRYLLATSAKTPIDRKRLGANGIDLLPTVTYNSVELTEFVK